jgi:hypothetical protein
MSAKIREGRMRRLLAFSAAVAALAVPAVGQYHAELVAFFPPQPSVFMQSPAINDRGDVLYSRPGNDPGAPLDGLLIGRAGSGRTEPVAPGFCETRSHSLNDSGQAALLAFADGAIYLGARRSLTLLAEPEGDPEFEFLGPAVNNRGAAAFSASLDKDGNSAVFLAHDGRVDAISDSEEGTLNYHSLPDINNAGEVAFSAYDTESHSIGVYLHRRGRIARLNDEGVDPALNDSGVVAFTRFGEVPGDSAVLRGRGGPITVIARTGAAFAHVIANDINNSGQVAFNATLRDGTQAILVGDDGEPVVVAAAGQALLGHTVAGVSTAAINNLGQVAAEVRFTDNAAAIVRFTPDQ